MSLKTRRASRLPPPRKQYFLVTLARSTLTGSWLAGSVSFLGLFLHAGPARQASAPDRSVMLPVLALAHIAPLIPNLFPRLKSSSTARQWRHLTSSGPTPRHATVRPVVHNAWVAM